LEAFEGSASRFESEYTATAIQDGMDEDGAVVRYSFDEPQRHSTQQPAAAEEIYGGHTAKDTATIADWLAWL
jgi:hypothetical protein